MFEPIYAQIQQYILFCPSLPFQNTSFLDETWRLPIVKQYQLVPSKDLGVKVSYVKNRAIVTDIDPGGLGADEVQYSRTKKTDSIVLYHS